MFGIKLIRLIIMFCVICTLSIVGNFPLIGWITSYKVVSLEKTTAYANDFPYTFEQSSVGGRRHIFLKSNYSDYTIQLSYANNNANPVIDQRNIAWEGFINDAWQIFLFDGIRVSQITKGDISVNPYISGDYLVFGRKNMDGAWYAELYNIVSKEVKKVAEGIGTKKPVVRNGEVVLTGKGYDEVTTVFVQDVLPFDSFDKISYVSESDIENELGLTD